MPHDSCSSLLERWSGLVGDEDRLDLSGAVWATPGAGRGAGHAGSVRPVALRVQVLVLVNELRELAAVAIAVGVSLSVALELGLVLLLDRAR